MNAKDEGQPQKTDKRFIGEWRRENQTLVGPYDLHYPFKFADDARLFLHGVQRLNALQQQVTELEGALVLAVKHGRSGMYPVNVHIRKALAVVDPEHFPALTSPSIAQEEQR